MVPLILDGFDKVYALIDIDDIITKNEIQDYNRKVKKRAKKIKKGKLVIIECNPCFEIWFLLHFDYTTSLFRRCAKVENELKKHIPDYSKNKKYLRRSKIYEKLRPNLISDAIPNSKRLFKSQGSVQSPRYPNCRVHKVILDLRIN